MALRTADNEIQEYRNLMTPPEEFHDGFSWKTIVGAIFLGMIMMPATMYLALFAGDMGSINQAGRWVTIIIFAEIARRSLKELKMQEVYILFYMAGLALAVPFQGLLWNQYFIRSDFATAMGIAQEIPSWVSPPAEVIDAAGRTFFTKAWLMPILYTSMALVIQKVDQYGLSYVMYRIANDVEELPFPMAPIGASGVVSLTETKGEKEPWRWRCFSIGGMLGMVFGAIYIGVPAITGVFLAKPVQLLPIPWIDFTPYISRFLPATPLNMTFNLGSFLIGTVIPFWAVMGSLVGLVLILILNPVLYKQGILSNWTPQMDFIDTTYINSIDFYLSFGIGLTISIAVIGIVRGMGPTIKALVARGRSTASDSTSRALAAASPSRWKRVLVSDARRGDFSVFIALGLYVLTSTTWLVVSTLLIEGFPWPFFLGYAFIYMPLIAYATASLEGMCGQALVIPMAKEATFILSGYQGIKIWFAPVPIPNYGMHIREFRVMELTGTKVISQIKTQLVTIPIVIISGIVFAQIFWQMAPVPSANYPFAQKMWDLQAKMSCVTFSATMEGGSLFMEAWKWRYVFYGLSTGVGLFVVLLAFGFPTLLVFGLVRGIGGVANGVILMQVAGAFFGRFYLRKKFGSMWMKYAPVLTAGFSCGMGLVAMLSIAFSILTRMMSPLIF